MSKQENDRLIKAADHWYQLQVCASQTSGREHLSYLKALIEFTEGVALMAGLSWIEADQRLRHLSAGRQDHI